VTAWWYWLGFFALALLMFAGPWLCSWLDDREDDRNAELWMQMPGATR
jgi:hypothetical protein